MPNTTFKKTIVETISVYNKRSNRVTSGHMSKQAVEKFFEVVGDYSKKSKTSPRLPVREAESAHLSTGRLPNNSRNEVTVNEFTRFLPGFVVHQPVITRKLA
jgi:hypothetical protein